jgi:pyrroloquinoline quinone biosynthesis protein D
LRIVNVRDDQLRPILARGVRLHSDPATGEPVLLFPEGALFLSPTAHDILLRCDGNATAGAIIAALANEYEVDAQTLHRDVWDCLGDLEQRKLVVLAK